MPSSFVTLVSLVLVVLCAAAYMHFTSESRRVHSIIDEKVKKAGSETADFLDLVSANLELGNHQFRARSQRVLLLLMRFLRVYGNCFFFFLQRCI
jgi:hypothetical protein